MSFAAGFSQASAADLLPAPQSWTPQGWLLAVPPVPPLWTGPYAGVQVGGGFARDGLSFVYLGQTIPTLGALTTYNPSGAFGGMHIGYNFEHQASVLGVEADIEGAGLRGTLSWSDPVNAPGYSASASTMINWQGSIRVRAGLTPDGFSLFYVTGGVAFAGIKDVYSVTLPSPNIFGIAGGTYSKSFPDTKVGYTIGAGLEHVFTPAITARVEYRFTDFGKYQNDVSQYVPGLAIGQHLYVHSVRVGASYHFL